MAKISNKFRDAEVDVEPVVFLELPGPETTFWYFQSLNLAVIQFGLFFSQMEIQERKESITVSAKNE